MKPRKQFHMVTFNLLFDQTSPPYLDVNLRHGLKDTMSINIFDTNELDRAVKLIKKELRYE